MLWIDPFMPIMIFILLVSGYVLGCISTYTHMKENEKKHRAKYNITECHMCKGKGYRVCKDQYIDIDKTLRRRYVCLYCEGWGKNLIPKKGLE